VDKGCDRKAYRSVPRERAICLVIPLKPDAKTPPCHFPRQPYRARARIEQTVGRLKRFRRVTMRWEKNDRNERFITGSALTIIPARSVHRA